MVLTGDRHATWVCDLKPDFADPDSPVTSAEITGTSISSGGDADNAKFHQDFDPIVATSRIGNTSKTARVHDLRRDPNRVPLVAAAGQLCWKPTGTTVHTGAEFLIESGLPGISLVSQQASARQRSGIPGSRRYQVDDDKF